MFRISQNICLATTAAWDRFPTPLMTAVASCIARCGDVLLPLSQSGRPSDSLSGQSIDKAILRVCVNGPERRRDLRVSVTFGGTESTAQQTT